MAFGKPGQGSANVIHNQVNVTNNPSVIVQARATRRRVILTNRQLAAVFVGDQSPSPGAGFQVDPGGTLTLYTAAPVYGITAAASGVTERVHVLEEYD